MEAKHTPGPWVVFDGDTEHPGIDMADGSFSIVVYGEDGEPFEGVRGRSPAETLANARLIAAAPDLLEALKEVQPYFEGEHSHDHPTCVAIRAAIAKAEGRTL